MRKVLLVMVGLSLWMLQRPFEAAGQILDDSTKNVYGPNTTLHTRQYNLQFNDYEMYTVDTLMENLHRFNQIEQFDHKYQDLGNLGTAMWPLFYQMPKTIGARSGFDAFDFYHKSPEDFKYFDTKSPYTDLMIVLGGGGRSIVDVEFARNITPLWNMGLDFTRYTVDKLIGAQSTQGDRNVLNTSYDMFTYYQSKDLKYHLMAYGSRMRHTINETGGVDADLEGDLQNFFLYEDAPIRIRGSRGEDLRLHYHAYQEYRMSDLLQVYHILDRYKQTASFRHAPPSFDQPLIYEDFLFRTDSTKEESKFRMFSNELGMKGNVLDLYYSFYYKRRDVAFKYRHLNPVGVISENYAGARARYDFSDDFNLGGELEYLQGGYYSNRGFINFGPFQGELRLQRYQPALNEQFYLGNHYEWNNEFRPIEAQNLSASYLLRFPKLQLRPKMTLTNINRHVYFNQERRPEQIDSTAQMLQVGTDVYARLKGKFHMRGEGLFTQMTGPASDVFRVPDWLVNFRFYYDDFWFNDNINIMIGFDVHWKSSFFGNAYDPITQQFYLQDEFELYAYPLVDVFVNFKILRASFFLKLSHANQLPNDGYFVTPYYPGPRRFVDFGVNWLFFD